MAAKAKSGERNPLKFVDVETDQIKWNDPAVSKAIDDGNVFQDSTYSPQQSALSRKAPEGDYNQFQKDVQTVGGVNRPRTMYDLGMYEEASLKNAAGEGFVSSATHKAVGPEEIKRKRSALDQILKQYR